MNYLGYRGYHGDYRATYRHLGGYLGNFGGPWGGDVAYGHLKFVVDPYDQFAMSTEALGMGLVGRHDCRSPRLDGRGGAARHSTRHVAPPLLESGLESPALDPAQHDFGNCPPIDDADVGSH
ncbi:hypothetical protein QAD02_002839 [Eretmocerus hayati]|uniref:Uncharacterized protein n=1 Tax=Eretmocerus hayati TaxID=131215 RepID=A0ACC2NPY3_9HYME|nr:hypothetical protein QAD02_002839 [Eretmocerus hayati]